MTTRPVPPGVPLPAPGRGGLVATTANPMRVLLVEDDEGDAYLVRELLLESDAAVQLVRARTIREAIPSVAEVSCVLLDLGLPDSQGLSSLNRVLEASPTAAVIVLTGLADERQGMTAVSAGAQDYLVKGQVDGQLLTRAIRYAVERKRADESVRELYESQLRAAEYARLERGLLPQPLLATSRLRVATRYRPGRAQSLLGGDFYDIVQLPDGGVLVAIGDVAGHGPDEAALGVGLRFALRTLALSGLDEAHILPALDRLLEHERRTAETFATMAMVRIAPDHRSSRVWLAGHPRPMLLGSDGVASVPEEAAGPALGLFPGMTWHAAEMALDPQSWLVLYTDGLIEGLIGHGPERLGEARLHDMALRLRQGGDDAERFSDDLVQEVYVLNGGPLSDDVALVVADLRTG